ncbi:MAG: preprotein translocase subunit SecE [Clostridia bacterium]|nr:preprotein translocase subunit SecE [Clostridia bacterium]MBO7245785.1 preprotein translocase subunit SecE [Clostridia bacterium]MBO7738212.1 preprotein translocase subunit SecE [Clostridia bacterium]
MKENRVSKFFKNSKSEFNKIAWPSHSQILKNSSLVISAILVFTVVVGGLDYLLETLVSLLANLIA